MMSKIINYLTGYLKIVVAGDYVERFINMCSHHQIEFWNLKSDGYEYEMYISVSDFRKIKPYIKKTKSKVTVKERDGFPFLLHRNRKRGVFLLCAMLCVFFLYTSTFFLWGIEFDGNLYCTEERLLEELRTEHIELGMRKESIDCGKITSMLRRKFDNITWASAYIKGTKLIICIKENNEDPISSEKITGKNIVAESDGIIQSMVTRTGTPMVHPGDHVKKGDLLVSGTIEVKNDADEIVEEKEVIPDAVITAQVTLNYSDKQNLTYYEKNYTTNKNHHFWIEIGESIFHLGRKRILFEKYTVETRVLFSKIGITFSMSKIREYTTEKKKYNKIEYTERLNSHFFKFCQELEKKGVQILRNDVKIYAESDCAFAKGNVTVLKDFGVEQ